MISDFCCPRTQEILFTNSDTDSNAHLQVVSSPTDGLIADQRLHVSRSKQLYHTYNTGTHSPDAIFGFIIYYSMYQILHVLARIQLTCESGTVNRRASETSGSKKMQPSNIR